MGDRHVVLALYSAVAVAFATAINFAECPPAVSVAPVRHSSHNLAEQAFLSRPHAYDSPAFQSAGWPSTLFLGLPWSMVWVTALLAGYLLIILSRYLWLSYGQSLDHVAVLLFDVCVRCGVSITR